MTYFFKTAAFWASLILLSYTLEIFGSDDNWPCQRGCRDEPDDNLCCKGRPGLRHREEVHHYKFLRNECERRCFTNWEWNHNLTCETVAGLFQGYRKVEMEKCTQDGQNYTAYTCYDRAGRPILFQECLGN